MLPDNHPVATLSTTPPNFRDLEVHGQQIRVRSEYNKVEQTTLLRGQRTEIRKISAPGRQRGLGETSLDVQLKQLGDIYGQPQPQLLDGAPRGHLRIELLDILRRFCCSMIPGQV